MSIKVAYGKTENPFVEELSVSTQITFLFMSESITLFYSTTLLLHYSTEITFHVREVFNIFFYYFTNCSYSLEQTFNGLNLKHHSYCSIAADCTLRSGRGKGILKDCHGNSYFYDQRHLHKQQK